MGQGAMNTGTAGGGTPTQDPSSRPDMLAMLQQFQNYVPTSASDSARNQTEFQNFIQSVGPSALNNLASASGTMRTAQQEIAGQQPATTQPAAQPDSTVPAQQEATPHAMTPMPPAPLPVNTAPQPMNPLARPQQVRVEDPRMQAMRSLQRFRGPM